MWGPFCGSWAHKHPMVGLSLIPKLAQSGLGSTQLTVANFSSPSSLEMGESSAKASLTLLAHSATRQKLAQTKPSPRCSLKWWQIDKQSLRWFFNTAVCLGSAPKALGLDGGME